MKTFKIISYLFIAALAFVGTSCNDVFEEITELETDRLFRPINFESSVNKTVVTLKWAAVKNAESYTLQIATDADFSNIVVNETLTTLTYVKELAGSTDYFARVRANAKDGKTDSEFNFRLTFRTPAENLFADYKSFMTAMNAATVRWEPGTNVTHVAVVLDDAIIAEHLVNETEKAAGVKTISNLANGNYTIRVYNGTYVRGSVKVVVEGDVYLPAGGDLVAAIAAATAGQVIVLEPGALYTTGTSTVRFDKNIKIRGLLPTNLPVIAMADGGPTATSAMFGFADNATFDYLQFQNVDITGYCANVNTNVKIGYIFNNNLMANVGTLSFENSVVRHMANTPVRLQGNRNQIVDNVIFRNTTIHDIGFGSTYAIVNSNSADFFNHVTFDGCTVYNFKGSLVLRTGQPMGSITIKNTTVHRGMMDDSQSRYLIDANNSTMSGNITIERSIFGKAGGALGGNGIRTTAAINVTSSFYTNDFADDPVAVVTSFSIRKFMSAFNGSSTDLWTDPNNGDFTLKNASFAGKGTAGDLRWY